MFRFYNPYTYEHLYTTDVKEAADLRSRGWNAEGIGWYSPTKDTPGVVKIYRLYNPYGDDHLYTTEEKEKDDCIKRGWKLDTTFEAYGFISKQLGAGTGISRLFNPYEKYHTHLFSANKKELEDNIKRGWKDEQVRWYVPGKPAETTPSATDTDVNVSTGSSSGSSHGDTTPSTPSKPKEKEKPTPKPAPTPSTPSKPAETSKPAQTSKYSEAARKDIFGNKAPDTVINELKTAVTTAETEANNLKEKGTAANATPEDKAKYNTALNKKAEADFKVDYATKVKALNEAAAALKTSPTDTKAKETYNNALKAVEDDENKFTPVTYTVHFKNDPQGKTGKDCSLKPIQVTIYKCIATQMYESILNNKATRVYSVERALAHVQNGKNESVIPDGYKQKKSKRITYDAKNNYYTVEYGTWNKHEFQVLPTPSQLPTVTPDSHNVTGLPELNLSMLAKDTTVLHASTSDSKPALEKQITANEAAIKTSGRDKRYETLDSYRAAQIASEKCDIDGCTEETYKARENAWKAYYADVSKLPYYAFPTALTSTQDPNLVLQTAWLKLKVAELDYNAAKTTKDAAAMLKARKDAVQAAKDLVRRDYEWYISSREDPIYIRWHLLNFMDYTILGNDAPDQNASSDVQSKYLAYVNAYTTWMNTPTTENMTALKNAEKTYKDLVKKKQLNSWDLKDILCDGMG